jgi:hypothetical protein
VAQAGLLARPDPNLRVTVAIQYQILPDLHLIYVRYDGVVTTGETLAAMQDCARQPNFDPAYRNLVDFSRATSFIYDYPEIMRVQAAAAGLLVPNDRPPNLVYFAPTAESQKVARLVLRSWEGVTPMVGVILAEREQVLAVLGLQGSSLDSLLVSTAP